MINSILHPVKYGKTFLFEAFVDVTISYNKMDACNGLWIRPEGYDGE